MGGGESEGNSGGREKQWGECGVVHKPTIRYPHPSQDMERVETVDPSTDLHCLVSTFFSQPILVE